MHEGEFNGRKALFYCNYHEKRPEINTSGLDPQGRLVASEACDEVQCIKNRHVRLIKAMTEVSVLRPPSKNQK